MKEDGSSIASVGSVFNDVLGTVFDFADGDGNDGKTAEYTFFFNVEPECSIREDFKEHHDEMSNNGHAEIKYFGVSIPDQLQPLIDKENKLHSEKVVVPEPPKPQPDSNSTPSDDTSAAPTEADAANINISNLKKDTSIGGGDDASANEKAEDSAEPSSSDAKVSQDSKSSEAGLPEQVQLKTGDRVSLATDVEEDIFQSFSSFRSTQFFVRDFEDADELLTALPEVQEKEVNWWQSDSGASMPWWTLILLIALVFIFVLLTIYIARTIRKNRDHRDAQELAIMQELQMAKADGLDIPEDLEKRLAMFEQDEQKVDFDGKNGGKNHRQVHPDKQKTRDKITRYATNNENSSSKLSSGYATAPISSS